MSPKVDVPAPARSARPAASGWTEAHACGKCQMRSAAWRAVLCASVRRARLGQRCSLSAATPRRLRLLPPLQPGVRCLAVQNRRPEHLRRSAACAVVNGSQAYAPGQCSCRFYLLRATQRLQLATSNACPSCCVRAPPQYARHSSNSKRLKAHNFAPPVAVAEVRQPKSSGLMPFQTRQSALVRLLLA